MNLDDATSEERRLRWIASVIDLRSPETNRPEPKRSKDPDTTATGAAPARNLAPPGTTEAPADTRTATPTGPPARKSPFASKARPKPPAQAEDSGAAGPTASPPVTEDQLGQIEQEIKAVLSSDDLATLAVDLDVSPEELEAMLQEPDFAGLVAEESRNRRSSRRVVPGGTELTADRQAVRSEADTLAIEGRVTDRAGTASARTRSADPRG